MTIRSLARLGASGVFALAAGAAFAHGQLDKASPPVGGTVSSPSEIRLKFTEGVEPRFSGIALSATGGAAQSLGKAGVDPSDSSVLIVKVSKKLPPGV